MTMVTGSSTAEVDAPIDQVWALVEDVERAPEWQGGLKGMHPLERDEQGHAIVCQTESDAKVRTIKSTVRFTYAGPTTLAWSIPPAVTATSGPGLSLMTEAIGLAVAAEVPIVVIDVMRGGPSTGIPAKSEQSDVNIALTGLHGDAPRIVVAPNSIADCVAATQWAVYLAEATQSPAIVLSDQYFGQTRAVVDRPPTSASRRAPESGRSAEGYKRYAITASGISPMAIPGTPGTAYTADGLEHNERGLPSSQSGDHIRQLDKRAKKLDSFDYGERWAEVEGEGELRSSLSDR